MRLWIKDPLAILADGAERGIVVEGGRIAELVPAGREPAHSRGRSLRGGRACGAARPDQHPPPLLPDPDPRAAGGAGQGAVSLAEGALPGLGAADAGGLDSAATVAMAELLLSGCTTTTDHHYVFPDGLEDAIDIEVDVAKRLGMRVRPDPRLDEPVGARRRAAAGQRRAGRGYHPGRQRAADRRPITSAATAR